MRRKGPFKVHVPMDDLIKRPSLNFPEAIRVSGYGRKTLERLVEEGQILAFPEGKRIRFVTESLLSYPRRKAEAQRALAS